MTAITISFTAEERQMKDWMRKIMDWIVDITALITIIGIVVVVMMIGMSLTP